MTTPPAAGDHRATLTDAERERLAHVLALAGDDATLAATLEGFFYISIHQDRNYAHTLRGETELLRMDVGQVVTTLENGLGVNRQAVERLMEQIGEVGADEPPVAAQVRRNARDLRLVMAVVGVMLLIEAVMLGLWLAAWAGTS